MDVIRQASAPPSIPEAASAPSPESTALEGVRVWLDGVTTRALAIVARDEHDDKDVHQMRLTTKRLRAFWQMLRPVVPAERVVCECRLLAGAARVMAADRDAFVLREVLQEVRGTTQRKKDQRAIDLVLEHLPTPRAAKLSPIRAYAEFLRQRVHLSLASVHDGLEDVTTDEALRAGVEWTYARAQSRGLKAYFKNSSRAFHRWRKWVKYLYYQVEILDPPGDEWKATSEALDQLGKTLGLGHDLANLRELLRSGMLSLEDGKAVDRVIELARRRERELIASARPLAAQVFTEHPAAFARRLTDS